ncbi:unnamed protein product [Owenia fusiformis]|uniref:5'-nucleotidase domain-containing protein 1 n=1 Tax=Owenia fusiformis TaxID=6347 RepID=A0A8S4PXP3_OWEFU|nr:unnamed protein product [Owenia fusiformis]
MSKFSLKFTDYDAFGFDLDHTLAKYKLPALFKLCHNALAEFLVKEKGYHPDLQKPFELDKDFCTKGLIFDTVKGNFFKLDENGTILRASHGTRFLSNDEICATYGPDRHWKQYSKLAETVNNLGDEFRIFENYFDMPGKVICARMVDILDRKGAPEKYDIWKDVFDGYNHVYNPKNFSEEKGGFFPEIKLHPEKYLNKCSEDIKLWLKKLKEGNRKVFILTSSYNDFATHLLKYILGENWSDYIDINLTFARKPGFFNKNRPFLRVDQELEKEPVQELNMGATYSQGNHKILKQFLKKATGVDDPKILFFGDSLRSDVFPAKMYVNWDTVVVLEEMEIEGMLGFDVKGQVQSDREDDDEPRKKKMKYTGPSVEEAEFLASSKWGSFFYDNSCMGKEEGKGPKMMNTFWGYLIRRYSDISIPQLDYIVDFPMDHEYNVFDHEDYKREGFYPGIPKILASNSKNVEKD